MTATAESDDKPRGSRPSFADHPEINLEAFSSSSSSSGAGRRVRIVSPTFDPEPIGTPLYAGELARWLRDSGWDVDVVTNQPHYPRSRRYAGYGRHRRRDSVDGLPVYRLPTLVPSKGTFGRRALSDVNFLVQGLLARRRLGRSPLTVVITPGVPFGIPVGRSLTASGGTLVVWVHDLQSGLAGALGAPSLVVRASAAVERRCLNLADHVCTLSEGMSRRVRTLGVERPTTVLPLWSTLPPDDGSVPDVQADVQYSGNIGRKQGADQLVDLAQGLERRRPGTTLLIRADAHARRALELEVTARQLGNVRFADLAPRAQLRQALRAGRVHVIPQAPGIGDSVLPSKVVNALAAGCRVVAAGEPGSAVAELAEAQPTMTVTRPGDVQGLIDAVLAQLDR